MKKLIWRKLLLSKQSLSKMTFMLIAALMLWVKTYIVYKISFDISVNSIVEEFILFINPLCFILFVLGISIFIKEKNYKRYVIIASFFISLLLYVDVVYYREFTDFITLPLIMMTGNFTGVASSVFSLIKVTDIIMFVDIAVLIFLSRKKPNLAKGSKFFALEKVLYFGMVIFIGFFNYGLATTQRTQLLTRTFDREMLVKYLGTYNYHIYDIFLQTKTSATRAMANSNQFIEIEDYLNDKKTDINDDYFGIAKGRNVVIIHMESIQSFVINNYVGDDEVTPFLNDLIEESYYFDNFYHQVAQGKSSDTEFLQDTSLYPLNRGAVFFSHVNNKYITLPNIVKDNGYYAAVFHGNNASFWNRDVMYKTLGYDNYFAKDYYNVTEENSVNYGLKDIDFFEQSIDLIKDLPQPFFTKFITLTNHYPFNLDEEDKLIEEYWSKDNIVNRYFTTVRYSDEALKIFFEKLKEAGLYENTVFIMYGDHYGIARHRKEAMSMYLNKEMTNVDTMQLQRVPLIIHIPGVTDKDPQVLSTVGGHIDLKPTILHLLGINDDNDLGFGTDLFAPERNDCVILRDGSFITEKYIYDGGICYDISTGEEVDPSVVEAYIEKANLELSYSDQIIYGDLFRFYNRAKQVSK